MLSDKTGRLSLAVLPILLITNLPIATLPAKPRQGDDLVSSLAGHKIMRVLNARNSPLARFARLAPHALLEDMRGRLWVSDGTGPEVARYEWSAARWEVFSAQQGEESEGLHFHHGAILPNTVQWIVESSGGVLWFAGYATQNGRDSGPELTTFDGSRWRNVIPPLAEQQSSTELTGLFADGRGGFWFWRGDELVHHSQGGWDQPVKLRQSLREPQVKLSVSVGAVDDTGSIWLLTSSGIVRSDASQQHWSTEAQPSDPFGHVIYKDRKRRLWFGSANYVYACDEGAESVTRLAWPRSLSGSGGLEPSPLLLNAIYEDRKGRVLFGLEEGLVTYDEPSKQWNLCDLERLELSNQIEDIIADRAGRIWIATSLGIVVLEE